MDSVSQIVLGAAVGEVVLGKRLGNKAMLWGAVGGTIPDLDVITKPLMTEVESLAFHRGISHSILFAVLAGLLFGWLIYRLYQSPYSRDILQLILSLFLSCIPISILYFLFGNAWNPYAVAVVAVLMALCVFFLMRLRTKDRVMIKENASLRSWQWMFFLAFLTHALLDTMTMYGTQLFAPFSSYRAAVASISVADPIGYTIPFIFCLVMASRYLRTQPQRRFWAWLGVVLSCTYLVFTMWHKQKVSKVFVQQMSEKGIDYDRYIVGPTIFNNFLWSMTAENEDEFYQAQYSIFDKSPIKFKAFQKQHHLLADADDDKTITTLKWFSNNYYNVIVRTDGLLQINDLRYGTFRGKGDENDFIFRFVVERKSDGSYEMQQTKGGPDEGETTEIFAALWNRIKGI